MKKVLSIVLVVVVALGTMAVAFADTGVDEAVSTDVECVYGEGNELGDAHRYGLDSEDGQRGKGYGQEGNMEQKQVGEGLGQGNRFGGQDGLKAQDGRGAGNGLGINGLQQRLQDGSQSGVGNGERLMDTENCPNQ
jgi:hypothetical protein